MQSLTLITLTASTKITTLQLLTHYSSCQPLIITGKNHNVTAFNTLLKLPATHYRQKFTSQRRQNYVLSFITILTFLVLHKVKDKQKPQTRNMPSLLKSVVIYYITAWTTQTWGMQFILSTITMAKTSKRETKSISINSKQSAVWKREKKKRKKKKRTWL